MLLPALLVLVGVYGVFALGLAWRIRAAPPETAALDDDTLPRAAVVVAARNEAACIAACVEALLAQDYPPDRLQIVVADDHSDDGTAEVVRRTVRRRALALAGGADDDAPADPCFRVSDAGPLVGKARALHEAIERTDAEVVLFTDADCTPPPSWVRSTASRFADPATGIVCGLTRVVPRDGRPFDRAQRLDWAFMLGACSALAEAGVPATGMGNNMAVRRAAYDAVGGYPAIPPSLTEDFTLVQAVAERTAWTVRFPIDGAATVDTHPADSLRAAYDQRRRWARGGLTGGLPIVATYAVLFAAHLAPLVVLAVAPVLGLAALAAKTAADGALLAATLHRVGTRFSAADLVRFEAFLFFYLLTLPAVLSFWPRQSWKGRRY